MIITATPQPGNFPPRVRLDFESEGGEFLNLTVLRDGRPIRQQPAVMGLSETFVYDYEAPFGVPVTYTVSGSVASGWIELLAEDWADLGGWEVRSGSPTVSGGTLSGGGVVARSDVPVGEGRAVISSGGSGRRSLTVGPVSVAYIGGVVPGWLASFRGGAFYPIPSPEVSWNESRAISGSTEIPPGSAAVGTEVLAWGGAGGVPGALSGFTLTGPVGGAVSGFASVTLDVEEAWLIHPIQPTLSVPIERFGPGGDVSVEASTDETRTYASRQVIYQPNGRREAVAYPLGPRGAGGWTLTLTTNTLDARNGLLNLLDDQAPVLLRSPSDANQDLPDGWYSVGDVAVTRPINIGHVETRHIALPLTKTAEPPVKVAPQLTWGDLMLRGVKWGDLLGKSWLQALMGEV